jgi:hypothetical protein
MVPQHARGEEYGYAYNRYEPKSKYGYSYGYGYGYGYGTTEPYGPLVLQSNLPATGQMRVPLEVRIKAKLANRKKVRASKAVEVVAPEVKSSEFEKLLAEIEKKYS